MSDDDPAWWAEFDPEVGTPDFPWQPTLLINSCALSLPVWFQTEAACLEFIARIPDGCHVLPD